VIDRGEISKRKKKASKQFREEFGHTPSAIVWRPRRERMQVRALLASPVYF
jgi:hypothetical protein